MQSLRRLVTGSPLVAHARAVGGPPKLQDKLVALTAATSDGKRFPIVGRVGQSLAGALAESETPEIVEKIAVISPRHGPEAHVSVAAEWLDKLPPMTGDDLGQVTFFAAANTVTPQSRLASQITLTKDLNRMVFSIGKLHPHKTL